MRYAISGCVLLTAFSIAFYFADFDGPSKPPLVVFEYKVLDTNTVFEYKGSTESGEGLAKLGAEGWELFAIEPGIPDPEKPIQWVANQRFLKFLQESKYYFKRTKRN